MRANWQSLIPALGGVILIVFAHTIAVVSAEIPCPPGKPENISRWPVCPVEKDMVNELSAAPPSSPNASVTAEQKAASLLSHKIDSAVIVTKEGKSRLAWITSAGILIMVALATLVGSVVLAYQGFNGHEKAIFAKGAQPGRKLLLLAICVALVIGVVGFLWQWLLAWSFTYEWRYNIKTQAYWLWGLSPGHPAPLPRDGLTNWWIKIDWTVTHIYDLLSVCTNIALLGLVLLISSTLYQGPCDAIFRRQNSNQDDKENAAYRRYLGRSFGRLRYGIYLGATLLAAVVTEISARYAWPASLLPDELSKAVSAFGQQYVISVGIYFSLFLAALYYPALVILRSRGREYYGARNPKATLAEQESWLEKENLSFTFSSNWSEFIAMLAPAASGLIPHFAGMW